MKEKSLHKNAIMGIINTLCNMIFPLLIFIYASRTLLPEGIGITQMATSITSYFDLFAALGIPLYAVREISRLRDDKQKQNENALEVFYTNIINATIMFFAYFVFISISYSFTTTFWIFFVYGLVILLNAIGVEWFFKANEDFAYITIRNIIVKVLSFLLIIIFVKNETHILLYSIISIGATFGYCLINFIKFAKTTKLQKVKFNYFKHIKPALSVFLMAASTTIYCSLDTVMIGAIQNEYDVGIYTAAYKITTSFIAIITAINSIMLPRLAYYFETNDTEKIKPILNTCYQLMLMLAVPVVIACEIFPENMIYILSGSEFMSATPALRVMAPIILFVALTNLIGIQIFYSSGNIKKTTISVFCGAIINVIINSILIPHYSYIGAAIGTVIAEFMVLVVQVLIGKELLIFKKFNFNIFKILIASIIAGASMLGLKLLLNYGYIMTLVIGAIISILVYFVCLLIMKESLIKSAINIIKNKFKRKKQDGTKIWLFNCRCRRFWLHNCKFA